MESRGQKFSLLVQEDQILKLLNSNDEEIMIAKPKINGKNRKIVLENNEKRELYSVSFKDPSEFLLKVQKEKGKEKLAILHTKVLDGNKFKLSIYDKEKYGSERFVEFREKNGSSFIITNDQRVVCEFISNKGPVGTSGGQFRIASKEFRNFNLAVVSLVITMQLDAQNGKGIGLYFKDTGQLSIGFSMKSSKPGKESNEMLLTPPSETSPTVPTVPSHIGSDKNKNRLSTSLLVEKGSGNSPPASPRKEPRKSRSSAKDLSPEDSSIRNSSEKESPPQEKESSKKGKGKKKKGVEKSLHSPRSRAQSESLANTTISIPGGDSYNKCWEQLEAIEAQSKRNQS